MILCQDPKFYLRRLAIEIMNRVALKRAPGLLGRRSIGKKFTLAPLRARTYALGAIPCSAFRVGPAASGRGLYDINRVFIRLLDRVSKNWKVMTKI